MHFYVRRREHVYFATFFLSQVAPLHLTNNEYTVLTQPTGYAYCADAVNPIVSYRDRRALVSGVWFTRSILPSATE